MLYKVVKERGVIDPDTGERIWLTPSWHPYRSEEPRHAAFIDQAPEAFAPWDEEDADAESDAYWDRIQARRAAENGYVSSSDWAAWLARIEARRAAS